MRTKGLGPQGLGIAGNNGYHIGSPATFKKHKMYGKDGTVKVAETKKEHLALKKKRFGHSSPAKSSGDPGASMNAAPIKCWKTHKRKPGTVKGAKGSCIKK